ncbi:MAG: undecaprenyl/decaprenyl-phosphate alpha-N-acetylglucosaminyl 1-phosphate transferase [Anaerolineaceae bacterium]|nr:undecaprenyl/decaprenyl-phosphate alpha-N-acetylglucosaminyl 1-phosphate transferase [Anaerolineaceae bacterium]
MTSYVTSTAYMFENLLLGLVLTFISSWFAIRLARRVGLIDVPGRAAHKLHQNPIPLAGGIALVLSISILIAVSGLWREPQIGVMLLAALLIFTLGLVDDAYSLRPILKLVGQCAAAILLILVGVYIQIFETASFFFSGSGVFFVWLGRILTILWIVGITNAFNLVDSMDGLAVGLGGWAFAFFMLATFDSQQLSLSALSALFLGACIAVYYYNKSPARLFLGDSGAQTLGFVLAAIAILYTPLEKYQNSSWFVPVLLLGVPIFDTSLVFISRLRRGKPVYQANRDHTYHRLVALGYDSDRAVFLMHLAGLVLECLAFAAVSVDPLYANLIFAGCLLAGLLLLVFLEHPKRCP